MGITREEIKNLLKEAIEPLERKLHNLNNGFQELKRLVDFVNGKYDDVLAQLKQANEKIQRQGTSLKQMRKDLDDATKQAQDAMNGFENLAEYLRRDCLEISGVPPSDSHPRRRFYGSSYCFPPHKPGEGRNTSSPKNACVGG